MLIVKIIYTAFIFHDFARKQRNKYAIVSCNEQIELQKFQPASL
jgi:hypothetical protein